MLKLDAKLTMGAVLASALLAGCGDSGSVSTPPGPPAPPTPPMEQTINNVADYVRNLIASAGENSEPTDINGLTLAPDDKGQPAAVN